MSIPFREVSHKLEWPGMDIQGQEEPREGQGAQGALDVQPQSGACFPTYVT